MLWTTKLTETGLSQSDFGETFKSNVKRFNRFTDDLNLLKKTLRSAPEKDFPKIQEQIETVKEALDELNKKLLSNIKRMVTNPDAVKANKERMSQFHKKKKEGGTAAAVGATSAATVVEKEVVTETPPPATEKVETKKTEPVVEKSAAQQHASANGQHTEKPKPAASTAQQQASPQTQTASTAVKKKSSNAATIGWGVLAFIIGLGTGVAIKNFRK